MLHFILPDADQQARAIGRLHTSGMSVTTIATATKMNVEQVQKILAESSTT
jgi:hypothetical protein